MSKDKKIVCAYVDPAGDMKEDYDFIDRRFTDIIGEHTFKKDVRPEDLNDTACDVYVFDYAGIGLSGASGLTDSVMRQMQGVVENKPGLMIVFWSSMSGEWYRELMEQDAPHLDGAENVVFANESHNLKGWEKKIRKWLGIPEA